MKKFLKIKNEDSVGGYCLFALDNIDNVIIDNRGIRIAEYQFPKSDRPNFYRQITGFFNDEAALREADVQIIDIDNSDTRATEKYEENRTMASPFFVEKFNALCSDDLTNLGAFTVGFKEGERSAKNSEK